LQFITRSVRFGVEYPGNIAVVIIEQAESDIGIPDVNNDGIHFLFFRISFSALSSSICFS
jgi:hypothetical protein